MRISTIATLAGATALGLVTISGPASAEDWKPIKPVEFVIMAGTGGGADQLARLVAGLIEQKKLSPVPFIPINKPGGSGAEALRYLKDKSGDTHTVMVTLNSFFTTPLLQPALNVDIEDFTPIGLMAIDTFLLWVHSDTDIETLDDYIEAANEAGKSWKMGGTGSGQEDSILTALLEVATGIDMTYVPYGGGGDVAQNLVGKHTDSTVNNPSEANEFWRAGRVRPVVQFTDERMDIYPDVPTAIEAGYDIEYYMQRSVNGPPDMPEEAQQWYEELFKALFESEEWQDYCHAQALVCDKWIGGNDLLAFQKEQFEVHKELIDEVGAAALTGE